MAKSKSLGTVVVVALALAAAGFGGWRYFQNQEAAQAPEYVTAAIGRGDLIQAVTATGVLEPVMTVEVGSQVSGIVDQVLVDYNTVVQKGQVIAHIDAATYESRLRSAQANLSNAQASQQLKQLNANRTANLQKQGLVPQSDLDQALVELAQADAQVLIQSASVESAKVDLSRCTIYAPIDGIVLTRQVDVGKTVAASFNTPLLFSIANDLTKMQIVGAIAEADIGNVSPDQSVNFTVDAFPNRQFRGRVSLIRNSPQTVQNVVTYETIIDVRNEDQKLRPGMTANVSVVIAERPNALRLPNGALRVRLPDVPPPPAPAGAAQPALKVLSEEEARTVRRELMREAGFTPGSGPPAPELLAKVAELAKSRGIELPAWSGPGGRTRERAPSDAPVVRTVYRLVGTDPHARPEAVNVKLGISDGTNTEILEGLAENDRVITSVYSPAGKPAAPAATSPFGGGRRF